MSTQPYTSAKRVFWSVDNGSPHRRRRRSTGWPDRSPNAVMVHAPKYCLPTAFTDLGD